MPNWIFSTLQSLMPSGGIEFRFITPATYRALKPTWPVVVSLVFIALAIAVPDQGRAILKFTVSPNGANAVDSHIRIFTAMLVLIIYCCIMMYSALLLTAVSRRKQLNAAQHEGMQLEDPVNSSIKLRLGFSYGCGIFLPLLFMLMCVSFEYELDDWEVWFAILIGAAVGFFYSRFASWFHPTISKWYSNINRPRQLSLVKRIGYSTLNILRLVSRSDRLLAVSLIVGSAAFLLVLDVGVFTSLVFWIFQIGKTPMWENFLTGAWIFFLIFLIIHVTQRVLMPKVIRLHQGQTSRYIIIDPRIERNFNFICLFFIPALILLLWWPDFVDFVGPLGAGLLGTMWITLTLTFLVERPSKYSKSRDTSSISLFGRIFSKPFIFTVLLLVLFIDSMLHAIESVLQAIGSNSNFFSLNLLMSVSFVTVLVVLIVMRKKIWGSRKDSLGTRIGRLPTVAFLSPLFFLSYGEAHHIHRISIPMIGAQSGDVTTAVTIHSIEDHAKNWIKARRAPEGKTTIPVIVVLAEGGGIRAAAHTGYFLSHLDSAMMQLCDNMQEKESAKPPQAEDGGGETGPETEEQALVPPPSEAQVKLRRICSTENSDRLLDHVYSINGVSGGSVGSAIYLAAVHEEQIWGLEQDQRHELIDQTIRTDLMSPLLAGLLGSDLLTGFIPVQLPDRVLGLFEQHKDDVDPSSWTGKDARGVWDRADFFENWLSSSFESNLEEICPTGKIDCSRLANSEYQSAFDMSLEKVARKAAGVTNNDPGPMVFFSTFYETGGFQMAAANVDIRKGRSRDENLPFCGSVPIIQQLLNFSEAETQSDDTCVARKETLPLSAAAHISARFPGANPTGVIETRQADGGWQRHFFVDGGYLDNSGTLTALQSLEALRDAARQMNEENSVGGPQVSLNLIVLDLFALSVPEYGAGSDQARPTKRDEITKIPSAALKARGEASRAPIRLFCNALAGFSHTANLDGCDEIFRRRQISNDDFKRFEDPKESTAEAATFIKKLVKGWPVLDSYIERVDLRCKNDSCNNDNLLTSDPIINASWIPIPLEVAESDRQKNAITALLGWTLLDETSDQINCVMSGTADLALSQILQATENWPSETRPDSSAPTSCPRVLSAQTGLEARNSSP